MHCVAVQLVLFFMTVPGVLVKIIGMNYHVFVSPVPFIPIAILIILIIIVVVVVVV